MPLFHRILIKQMAKLNTRASITLRNKTSKATAVVIPAASLCATTESWIRSYSPTFTSTRPSNCTILLTNSNRIFDSESPDMDFGNIDRGTTGEVSESLGFSQSNRYESTSCMTSEGYQTGIVTTDIPGTRSMPGFPITSSVGSVYMLLL